MINEAVHIGRLAADFLISKLSKACRLPVCWLSAEHVDSTGNLGSYQQALRGTFRTLMQRVAADVRRRCSPDQLSGGRRGVPVTEYRRTGGTDCPVRLHSRNRESRQDRNVVT